MNFYQAMQLDVSVCKGKIRNAANPSERHKLIAALIVKDILCVLFAVVFISILNFLFGDENSSAAVVIFCILLTVRFVDFGYCLKSSLINFFIVFVLLTFSPCIAQSVNPAWGFLINFLSIGFIVISACHEPLYGGAGLYLFAGIRLADICSCSGYSKCCWDACCAESFSTSITGRKITAKRSRRS